MIFLYNISVFVFNLGVRVAGLFHAKARAFVTGRKNVFRYIAGKIAQTNKPVVWVHCASLGEFEQGRPIMEAIKREFEHYEIVLTFFSPSGFEIRKNYPLAFIVSYLPLDTHVNATRFVDLVKPRLAIFIKYEFWYHYSHALRKRNIPLLSVSSIFRPDQVFFGRLGKFYQRILWNFSYFFVQNEQSTKLLASVGIYNVQISGDTRFDRVNQIAQHAEDISIAKKFKGNQRVFVVGSSWPEDMDVLIPFVNENRLKFIIAPHEVSEASLTAVESVLHVKHVRYSQAKNENVDDCSVLIIDNVGLLSRLYGYGEFAYVGGAFGKGLHNVLEAACYGIPVFFGNKNYEKFQEATDLIKHGGAFEIKDYQDLKQKYEMLNNPQSFLLACDVTKQYVQQNLGATERVMQFCRPLLTQVAYEPNSRP
ncbi:MAG TPA: glycosyltransferase N-terminal domain-containing protein [Chryseosolibacter sp.]|nr:glycosyltransferase N-terminal domain-containing protein [Chryseosolibacter sp.]